ncbi:MAG: adenine methyltransferase [Enterocloster asparagiformis]|jgi:site-specific DNA-methyltransferase (adenine-specific)|nr:adenine methyltransferase [Enterocloster asparagiformis]DAN57326.1 MAG TPA: DNA N-6-adenine-methyltransferase [Caudoviricetes sp.]
MLNRSLVSSNSNEWATPQKLFDMLDSEFHFTLDPCSSHMNCKTDKHYTINENGLQQDWSGEHVFMNPPYGYQTSQWIEKAYKESLRGAVVVCLIVARTDTSYWHDIIFKYAAQLTFG